MVEVADQNDSTECKSVTPHQRDFCFDDGMVISSKFDSGNCVKVARPSKNCFQVWTARDCESTPYETDSRTWFYFSVSGVPSGNTLTFMLMNMNKQNGLYSSGMKPVFRTSKTKWRRVSRGIKYEIIKQPVGTPNFKLVFQHHFEEGENETTYFSFCYPYTYSELQSDLSRYESTLRDSKSIYFNRSILTTSLEGRNIDILTITSLTTRHHNNNDQEESNQENFQKKPIVFVSARVHPGETPASFSFNGFLDFILLEKDKRAKRLRETFVFKLVPMLNPDGVALGHYRADTRGVNLNRQYSNPCPTDHPVIFAVKKLLVEYSNSKANPLYLYLDMHAHANKKGCFLFGNRLPDIVDQVENMSYAYLVASHSAFLDINTCNFSAKNMKMVDQKDKSVSKEGSGRVAIYKATSLARCYTLECNYNTGKRNPNGLTFQEYTPETWANCGQGCAMALLDLWQSIPQNMHQSPKVKLRNHISQNNKISKGIDSNPLRELQSRICSILKNSPTYVDQKNSIIKLMRGSNPSIPVPTKSANPRSRGVTSRKLLPKGTGTKSSRVSNPVGLNLNVQSQASKYESRKKPNKHTARNTFKTKPIHVPENCAQKYRNSPLLFPSIS